MPEAVTAAPVTETQSNRPEPGANLWSKCALAAIAILILAGLGLRLSGLESIGFAEDEINKLEAVHAYDRHDFSANAEHPMLMKVLMDVSLLGARAWNSLAGGKVSEEAALRFPNVLLGALTVWPMFLLTAAFFDRRTGIWAAAFWAFGVNAITYNRIGKEDTLMVFFMLFAFYFFLRAKQVDTRRKSRVRKYLNLSAISFGLMMAAKYFPHYLGLNMLYHHNYHLREGDPDDPRFSTPLVFFLLIGLTFLLANPGLLLPGVWNHLNAYSGEKLLTHTGYLMGSTIYRNRMSDSPFRGLPVYFYLLFLGLKVPLSLLATFLLGLVISVKQWRRPGPRFLFFMLLFWIVPYSLVGAKWLRYTLSLMPFIYMGAAVGALVLLNWLERLLTRFTTAARATAVATTLLAVVLVAVPGWTAYATAPHYALYSNVIGAKYTAYFFPHDEFYDDGVNDAIRFVCQAAPRNAIIASETPGVVRYYTEKFGRSDLQSRVLSDPNYTPADQEPTYVILQKGRTYLENQVEMKQVRDRFTLVYAGCIKGHTAAEVYAGMAGASDAVQPCDDARP
ncbi:MAG TPA: glycosyltransferase family 39 protein [Pyrinomonadaceae bacterium]|nr:glycosyltransferase family 39 protein [Pyrinomonadaceae bacterium]